MEYKYHYNPEQPRDNKGKWVDVSGYQYGDRITGKDGSSFIYQDPKKVKEASKLVHAMGVGSLFSTYKTNDPRGERAYINATQWGEQRVSASSPHGFISVVDKDSTMQEDTYSFCRGAERQPLGKDASEENPGLGGRPAQLTNRKMRSGDLPAYAEYDVTGGELATFLAMGDPKDRKLEPDGYMKQPDEAFNSPRNVGTANFTDVAEQVANVRHQYKEMFGVDDSTARGMNVRLSLETVPGSNPPQKMLKVSSAYRQDKKNPGVPVKRGVGKKNSGVCVVRARDLTAFSHGMHRAFGENANIRVAIGEGTAQGVNGGFVKNALFIQQEKVAADGHRLQVRGCLERGGYAGTQRLPQARTGEDKMYNSDRNQRQFEDARIRRRGTDVHKQERSQRDMAAIISVRSHHEVRSNRISEQTINGEWEVKEKGKGTVRYSRDGDVNGYTNIEDASFAVAQVRVHSPKEEARFISLESESGKKGSKVWTVVNKKTGRKITVKESGQMGFVK